jgi:hypothetical protein
MQQRVSPASPPILTGRLFRAWWFWFALAGAMAATRHLSDLVVPQLRNEDGLVFFQQALVLGGWRMIWWPYEGYLHLPPRLIAALLGPLPLEWAPLAYNLSALIVVAATTARIGTARIPRLAAIAGAIGLVAVPGNCVGCINPDLLHLALAALIAVNLLEPVPDSNCETARRGAEMLVASLSGPEGIVLLPFVFLRGWQWRRSWRGFLMLSGIGVGAAIQCVIYLGDHRCSQTQWQAAWPSVGILSRYAKLLFGGWFGAPYDSRVAAAVLAPAIAGIASTWSSHGQRHRWTTTLVLLGGFAFLCAGRAASHHWAYPFAFDLEARHIYLPFAAVFWSLGWLAAGVEGWRRAVPALLAAAVIASALPHWTADLPPNLHWSQQVTALREGRSPIFADARRFGIRCITPLNHSALLWVPCTGADGQPHAFAICVPCAGPVTTEDPDAYFRRLQLP